jgi:hypothetical protein
LKRLTHKPNYILTDTAFKPWTEQQQKRITTPMALYSFIHSFILSHTQLPSSHRTLKYIYRW